MPLYVISGASSGIGRATAVQCAERGYDTALLARNTEKLEKVAEKLRTMGTATEVFPCDVSNYGQVSICIRDVCKKLGSPDVVIANAGLGSFGSFASMEPGDLERMMATNAMGTMHLFRAVLPHMLDTGRGHLVAVSSIAGLMGFAGMAGYCASKFALTGLMQSLRSEIRHSNVRVTMVCPGEVDTDFFQHADRTAMPGASRLIKPLKAEDVARAILKAVRKNKKMVVIPFSARLFVAFHAVCPGFARFIFDRASTVIEKQSLKRD